MHFEYVLYRLVLDRDWLSYYVYYQNQRAAEISLRALLP